ncbi:MAG: aminotransferase class V-fold PLP-dependent enzyme, partial [Candidatus Omnitrophica bacterium]|nr:aminotransferase class V-fold PLP-dependent enzyme [Candidatus Omnitrophota bacterium]
DFLNRAYSLHSQSNPLHPDLWPSASKFESEIISMTGNMLGGDDQVCGAISSGGTESILLAMKAYRDWAIDKKGIKNPEMVAPTTAHAAFDKASQYFNISLIRVPVDQNYKADVAAMRNAVTKNTAVIIGSAVSFPHGVIDPIPELSEMAQERGIGFHTDACLGGFVLPWAKKLGYDIPDFDFSLPGVTSISVDTHKYGYAPKGSSVILYRNSDLRSYQFFAITEWPGGLYCSPTFAGSRPGGPVAACWAALLAMGEKGYLDATQHILETGERIRIGIEGIEDLHVLGDPLWVIAFGSETLDIYQIMELMTQKGWSLNGLHHPPCVHLCVTLRHTEDGVAEKFLKDLKESVEHVRNHPEEKTGSAPVYGMAATLPFRGVVSDLLKKYLEVLYKT